MQTNETHTARFGLLAILTTLAVFAVFALVAQGLFGRIPVELEGQRSSVQVGDSVEEALAGQPSLARPGDLLAATDGRVVQPGGGRPPRVTINGSPASLDARVAPGDTIEVEPGADAVESTVEETRVISVPAEIVGTGAMLTVTTPGAEGLQRVVVGAVSGDVVASETIVPAEPMVLQRTSGDGKKVVALTFDDGPWHGQTEKILDILKKEHVPATFFMLGMYAKKQPKLVARVIAEGHDVGNHTYHHVDVSKIDKKKLRSEIEGTNAVIRRAGGEAPEWFRPPMGRVSEPAYSVLKPSGSGRCSGPLTRRTGGTASGHRRSARES